MPPPPASHVNENTACARVVFAHGKESGPWGSKICHLADIARTHGFIADSIDYQGMTTPQARLLHLLALQDNQPAGQALVLVGSSMGGYVSAFACEKLAPHALFLLAPALYMDGYPGEPAACPSDTVVVHGWNDDVVPVESSICFARSRRAALHLVDDGHRLAESLALIGELLARQLRRVLDVT